MQILEWYCNVCNGNLLDNNPKYPKTCTCKTPHRSQFEYSVGDGIYKVPNDGRQHYAHMIGGGGSGMSLDGLSLDPSSGTDLDNIAKNWDTSRYFDPFTQKEESDESLRRRIKAQIQGKNSGDCYIEFKSKDPHAGHEVVENFVLGKAFKYCRQCKVEVP